MTLVLAEVDDVTFSDVFVVRKWLPKVKLIGPEKIPALDPVVWPTSVRELVRFRDRPITASTGDSVVHFYASDDKLRSVLANPRKTLGRVQSFAAVITPDFSLYRNLPRHQRIFHTWSNRAVGALYQSHGIKVIPNIRWSSDEDFAFCFDGVPIGSTVAVSAHGCCARREDRAYFRRGLEEMMRQVEPATVIVHGPKPNSVFHVIEDRTEVKHFPAAISSAHKKDDNGRR